MLKKRNKPRARSSVSPEDGRRDAYDWLMFAVGFVGVIAVVATIWIGRADQKQNGAEVAAAIDRMAAIANAMQAEQPLLKRQADALTNTAAAAQITAETSRRQSDDFRRQTQAIVRQADALIRSAQATVIAANAELRSAEANTRTAEAGRLAAGEQLKAASVIAASQAPVARLINITLDGWADAPGKNGKVRVLVKPILANVGGGSLRPGVTTFSIRVAKDMPPTPPEGADFTYGGNDIQVPPNGAFSAIEGREYEFEPSDIADVNAYRRYLWAWGQSEYSDVAGNKYRICFGVIVRPKTDKSPLNLLRAFTDAYHCGGG